MRTTHLHIADQLLEYILPYPGEKDIQEIEEHLNISPFARHCISVARLRTCAADRHRCL